MLAVDTVVHDNSSCLSGIGTGWLVVDENIFLRGSSCQLSFSIIAQKAICIFYLFIEFYTLQVLYMGMPRSVCLPVASDVVSVISVKKRLVVKHTFVTDGIAHSWPHKNGIHR